MVVFQSFLMLVLDFVLEQLVKTVKFQCSRACITFLTTILRKLKKIMTVLEIYNMFLLVHISPCSHSRDSWGHSRSWLSDFCDQCQRQLPSFHDHPFNWPLALTSILLTRFCFWQASATRSAAGVFETPDAGDSSWTTGEVAGRDGWHREGHHARSHPLALSSFPFILSYSQQLPVYSCRHVERSHRLHRLHLGQY